MDLGLTNKVALVCAASRGLGRAAAAGLALEGAKVVICSRNETRIREAAAEIGREVSHALAHGRPGRADPEGAAAAPVVVPVVADVSLLEDIRRLVAGTIERFGRIDILVTNAGGPPVAEFLDLDDDSWQAGARLTLMSVVRLIRETLPHMRAQRWGRIINITSIAALQPVEDLVLSSTLRPGILGLAKVLANRYGAEGILINNVAPGHILTDRQKEILEVRARDRGITQEQYLAELAQDIPLRRLGRPEELASAIVFLASERASYINGATLSVDGGIARSLT